MNKTHRVKRHQEWTVSEVRKIHAILSWTFLRANRDVVQSVGEVKRQQVDTSVNPTEVSGMTTHKKLTGLF